MKSFLKVLFGSIALFSVANATSLSDLYKQYDNVVVSRIAYVKSIDISLYPNRGNFVAGQILIPEGLVINKIQLQIKNERGDVFWEKTDILNFSKDAKGGLPFKYKLEAILPEKEKLLLSAKLLQDSEVVGAGSVTYENKNIESQVLATISDVKFSQAAGVVKVETSALLDLEIKQSVALFVTVLDASKNVLFSQKSKAIPLLKNIETPFELTFDAPEDAGNYFVEMSLQDESKKLLSGVKTSSFLVDGTFAKIRKMVFSQPDEFFEKGDSVEISSEGFVNKNVSSLNIVAKIVSPDGKTLFKDDFSVPVNKFREFSFSKQFVLPVATNQLLGTFSILHNGDVLVEEIFNSQIYKKKPISEAINTKKGSVDNTKNTSSINWVIVMVSAIVLLLIVIGILLLLKKNKSSIKNLIVLLSFFGATFMWSNTNAIVDTNCAPEVAASLGANLHCQFFEDEFYNGLSGDNFSQIPLVATAVDTATSLGFLTVGIVYDIYIAVCNDSVGACDIIEPAATATQTDITLVDTTNPLTAIAANWFSVEVPASVLPLTSATELKRIKAVFLAPRTGGGSLVQLEYATPYSLTIDNEGPTISFLRTSAGGTVLSADVLVDDFYDNGLDVGEVNVAANFTKDEVSVLASCSDAGAGCTEASYTLLVEGNFCADGAICNDDTDDRSIEMCDKVGNCVTEELILKNFDNQAPIFGNADAAKLESGSASVETSGVPSTAVAIKAFETFLFSLNSISDLVSPVPVDAHVCGLDTSGDDPDDKIIKGAATCEETIKTCAISPVLRGEESYDDPGNCVNSCSAGFLKVDCVTALESPTGLCCLPPELVCGYRFPFCFPFTAS